MVRQPLFSTLITVVVVAAVAGSCASPEVASSLPTIPVGSSGASAAASDSQDMQPNATIDRIVDGDTIIVLIGGRRERVRLIGIDTPESVDQNRPVQCYGHEASEFLESLLPPGTPVSLIRDVEARDQYERLLAYVVRTDDQLFVNLDLIEKGFAATLTYPPNDHYATTFESAAHAAAANGLGLWGACGGPDVPVP